MERFVDAWLRGVYPLRRRFGFHVAGAWVVDGTDEFVWIIGHEGDFAAADRRYYESAERKALAPDPAAWIEPGAEQRMMRSVLPTQSAASDPEDVDRESQLVAALVDVLTDAQAGSAAPITSRIDASPCSRT